MPSFSWERGTFLWECLVGCVVLHTAIQTTAVNACWTNPVWFQTEIQGWASHSMIPAPWLLLLLWCSACISSCCCWQIECLQGYVAVVQKTIPAVERAESALWGTVCLSTNAWDACAVWSMSQFCLCNFPDRSRLLKWQQLWKGGGVFCEHENECWRC